MPRTGTKLCCVLAAALLAAAGCASQQEGEAFVQYEQAAQPRRVVEADRPTQAEEPVTGAKPAAADELPEDASLQDLLAYAALHNPGLEAAFARWKAALERIPQMRSLPDPRFAYEINVREGLKDQKYEIEQMFPWFGKLDLQGNMALAEARAAQERYEAQKLALFSEVRQAWYEYAYLYRGVAVVRQQMELVRQMEEVARTRYRSAAADRSDVLRAQVELGKLDNELRTIKDALGPARARLNAALNRSAEAPLPTPQPIAECKLSIPDARVLALVRESNPELRAMSREIESRAHAVALARRNYYPDIGLGLNYKIDDMGGMGEPRTDPIMAMMSVNLPIWRGKYRAAEREAHARKLAAAREKADYENMLDARVKRVLYGIRDAQRRANLYRETLLPKAREALKTAEAAFRAGAAGFTDLIDSQRMLLEFELAHERALADNAQGFAELEMLLGGPVPPDAVEPGRRSATEGK